MAGAPAPPRGGRSLERLATWVETWRAVPPHHDRPSCSGSRCSVQGSSIYAFHDPFVMVFALLFDAVAALRRDGSPPTVSSTALFFVVEVVEVVEIVVVVVAAE